MIKKILWVLIWIACLGLTETAHAQTGKTDAPQGGAVLCLPQAALSEADDCLLAGPAQYLTDMAQKGITFPPRPLPAQKPDPALVQTGLNYAKLKENQDTPVYGTFEDAQAGVNAVKVIAAGALKFISYSNTAIVDGGEKPDFFELRGGGWISVESVASRISAVPWFQGLAFERTPPNAFGWIVPLNPNAETKHTPGLQNNDFTGHTITEYGLVQIYAVEQVKGSDWYMVGPDEWLEGRLVGMVTPRSSPPEGVSGSRWIEVNLEEQTLAAYDNGQLVFATMIATGLEPFWTRPGVFQIYNRLETTVMAGTFEADRSDFYYLEDVPWTMYFDDARALHGAYWRTRFGFPQSHGCVNLSPGDAHWLFDWAKDKDWVYVWDPSGKTPTDPKLYTYGAP